MANMISTHAKRGRGLRGQERYGEGLEEGRHDRVYIRLDRGLRSNSVGTRQDNVATPWYRLE
jgi:hypothetical protein